MDELRFESRGITEAVCASLLGAYLEEISGVISGFDAARAAPPAPAEFDPPGGAFLVAFCGAEPVGCGGVRQLGPGVGEIRRMWVAPSARGRGYGQALLGALEDAARAAGYEEVRLDTHGSLAAALALYRRAGYVEIERYNDNDFAEHFFAKRL